ncbi:MAG: hypothetical protein HC927_02990 [Deltaproteobacteria bacterium]|nr:hypothetical protein [Deltaproteobacteria bacterium]
MSSGSWNALGQQPIRARIADLDDQLEIEDHRRIVDRLSKPVQPLPHPWIRADPEQIDAHLEVHLRAGSVGRQAIGLAELDLELVLDDPGRDDVALLVEDREHEVGKEPVRLVLLAPPVTLEGRLQLEAGPLELELGEGEVLSLGDQADQLERELLVVEQEVEHAFVDGAWIGHGPNQSQDSCEIRKCNDLDGLGEIARKKVSNRLDTVQPAGHPACPPPGTPQPYDVGWILLCRRRKAPPSRLAEPPSCKTKQPELAASGARLGLDSQAAGSCCSPPRPRLGRLWEADIIGAMIREE